jgi:hypothetical protein
MVLVGLDHYGVDDGEEAGVEADGPDAHVAALRHERHRAAHQRAQPADERRQRHLRRVALQRVRLHGQRKVVLEP